MSQNVPTAATEHVSVDNIPTGNVELLIRRHEMPDKLLVRRYWSGMEKPEQLAYVPERTCHNVHEPPKDTTFWPAPHFKCSECGATHVSMEYVFFCPSCGRKVVDE